jgi:hypothetical protein
MKQCFNFGFRVELSVPYKKEANNAANISEDVFCPNNDFSDDGFTHDGGPGTELESGGKGMRQGVPC